MFFVACLWQNSSFKEFPVSSCIAPMSY